MTGWQSTTSPWRAPYENDSTLVALFLFLKALCKRLPSVRPTTLKVTSMPGKAASAQPRSDAVAGTPRRGTASCTATLFLVRVLLVGIDDARDQRMAHHVLGAELGERDAAHPGEDA